jgi:hypothetical protein
MFLKIVIFFALFLVANGSAKQYMLYKNNKQLNLGKMEFNSNQTLKINEKNCCKLQGS